MPSTPAITKLSAGRTRATVTFDEKDVTQAEEIALKKLGGNVSIPGFRAGKAPAEVLREKVPGEHLLEETVRSLASPLARSIPAERNMTLIAPPKLEVKSLKPLTIEITFVERPEVKVNRKKISVDKKEVTIDPKDVDRMVRYLREQERTFRDVERPARPGDQITIDFHGTDADGKEIAGIRTKNYSVILGSNTLIPGFEDALAGLKKGEEKSFTLTFPEKYHAEHLRGKPVTFSACVTKVEQVDTPELTDAFVKERGLGESAADLRSRIEGSLREQEEKAERGRRETALFDAIASATGVDLAPELLEQTEQAVLMELEERLQKQGLSVEQWMEQRKKKPADLHKELHEQAEKRLRLRFGVEELLKELAVEVPDADVDRIIEDALKTVPEKERTEAKARFEKGGGGYEELRWRRKVEKLVEKMLHS